MNTTSKKSIVQPKLASDARKPAVAPAVYRPQPAPRVLQPKVAQMAPCKHGNNKKTCKFCKQSQEDRNVNKFVAYQTPNKKTIEKDVEKVKELKTNLAHGKGNSQSNQSGKTKKLLGNLNGK
jgi:hypothetical protein